MHKKRRGRRWGRKARQGKGKGTLTLSPHLPNPRPLFPSFQSLPLSTPAAQAINSPSSSLVYICWHVVGTSWGKLIEKQVNTLRGRIWWEDCGRIADGVLVSPLHSQTNFVSETFFRLDKNNWLLDARFTFLNIILTLYFRWLFLEFGSSQQ